MLFLYLPILTLIVLSFNDVKSMSVWGGFSLHWYAELFQSRLMMGAIVNTFSIAILASLIATVVGTLAVLGMAAMRPRTQNVLLGFNNIPMLNADIVTGIALMLFFLMIRAPRGYMTILFSHATFCIPYVILSVRPRVNKNTDRLYEAALDLGASEKYAFRKIVLPLVAPGIAAIAMLSFMYAWNEYTYSIIFVQSPTNYTVPLALAVLNTEDNLTNFGLVAAGGVISVIPITLFVIFAQNYLISGLASGAVKE